ncbi:MAG: DUF2190 domain-containing protein [Deltaproteobacteria bacterium HGW-Deltaproteobacteria-8]|jgi:hypothetical protein|nr:MAG: DUF2190 domain-containing protein [Deltaproteobacteria bacterium HGW-Deltaproteobacteria-8]
MGQLNIPILTLSVLATGTITARRFTTAAGAQAGAGANALGVSEYSGVTGDMIPVTALGTSIVEAGAAFDAGVELEADATGRAILKTTGKTLARALQAATQAGDFVEVFHIPN